MRKDLFTKLTCIAFWLVLLASWTTTYRTDTPGDSDDPSDAPTEMRAIKSSNQERLDIDHYYTASASQTYDATDTGKHRFR